MWGQFDWALRRLSFLTQYWHWIFALNYNRIWNLPKTKMLNGFKMNLVSRYGEIYTKMELKYPHGKQICNSNVIFTYTCTYVLKIQQHYIFQLPEIYVFLAAVSDCQSRLYALLLFWFCWLEDVRKTLWKYSYISSMFIYPHWILFQLQNLYQNCMILLISFLLFCKTVLLYPYL